MDNALFCWFNDGDTSRNATGKFRRSFEINGEVSEAIFHLYADTVYQLFVNGTFVEFGPTRSDPRFPMYDSIDLKDYLVSGKNVIALYVNFFGCKTYKAIPIEAAFKSWGAIKHESDDIDLSSNADNWRGKKAEEHSRYTRKISFALDTAEHYDQALDDIGWQEIDFDDSKWSTVIAIKNQSAWGELTPRSIPFMSGESLPLRKVAQCAPLRKTEDVFSFTVPFPAHFDENDKDRYSNFLALRTYIYAPEDMDIPVGVFWGENWLNGEQIPEGPADQVKSMRLNQIWHLNKGWNYLMGKVGIYFDIYNFYLSVPRDKGIHVSIDKNLDAPASFEHSPILLKETFETTLANKQLPYAEDDTLSECDGWVKVGPEDQAQDPGHESSWDEYGNTMDAVTVENVNGFTFTKQKYPDGFTLRIDQEFMHLVFPELELSGVKGATIDCCYSEHLCGDQEHLRISHNYSGADRIICSEDTIKWRPIQPRGMRYFRITVRNTSNDVTINKIRLRSAHYPVEHKGFFECNDQLLNRIWKMGRLTQACNMEDAYVDCSGRERGMYARDTIIQYHNALAAFGDQKLMGRCMQLYGQSSEGTQKFRAVYPNTGTYTIADFALDLVDGYKRYYDCSGDKQRIEDDWDKITHNLDWFHELSDERDDLLLDGEWDVHRGVFANYGGFHGDNGTYKGYQDFTGIHAAFTFTYIIAMQAAHDLASLIGKDEDAAELQRRLDIIRPACQQFWDDKKQCVGDNLDKKCHSLQANALAVSANVYSEDQLHGIKQHIEKEMLHVFKNGYNDAEGTIMSPAYSFYIFDGVYKAGLADVAERAFKEAWGWALAQGCMTAPEFFSLRASLCHAWSACPTYYLSRHTVGIFFDASNFNKVKLMPQAGPDISYAHGIFPHPKGQVEVKWTRREDGSIEHNIINVPAGVEVEICN